MKGNRSKILPDGDYAMAHKELLAELRKTDNFAEVEEGSPFTITYNGVKSDEMTWHHKEDGQTMQAVLKTEHDKARGKHTGGRKIAADYKQLVGLFNEK